MFPRKRISFFFRRLFQNWNRSFGDLGKGLARNSLRLLLLLMVWVRSRRWRYLAQGLPALLMAIGVVVLCLLHSSLSSQELEARYLDRAQNAFKAKDYPLSMICYERLAALGQDRPENLYEMAVALDTREETERAFKIMNQLAPVDQTGYGPAHLWQGVYHLRNFGSAQQRKLAEAQLQRALQAHLPDAVPVHDLLGKLYARTGRPDQAALHLARAVESRPSLRLLYAEVLAAQGLKSQAADQAKLAANFWKTRAQADVKDKGSRMAWAEVVAFLEDFPQAQAILEEGYHLSSDAAYGPAMARLCLMWHAFVVRTNPEDMATQWNLLQRGLALDSTNPQLLDRLLGYLGRGGEEADKARALIHKSLAKGEATATTHFLLGMDAWQRGEQAEAQVHWERANQMAPNMPVVANNLAFLLAHARNADLRRALELINLVVDKLPLDATYRDTRGRIYFKLSRALAADTLAVVGTSTLGLLASPPAPGPLLAAAALLPARGSAEQTGQAEELTRKALADLELVLARDANFPGIHAVLADVYDQLHVPAMSAEHRRQAKAQAEKLHKAKTK